MRSIPHRYEATAANGEMLWRFDRTFSFALSKMTVHLVAEQEDVDRRLALAAAVLLCAQEEDDER